MRAIVLVLLLSANLVQADSKDKCKKVAAKPTSELTQADINKCKGPIIAVSMCNGWREGKTEIGCKDRKTSISWANSSDMALRAKGDSCLAGAAMDIQCGL